jgi:glutamyl/glutaminyl-tRNA synthetase
VYHKGHKEFHLQILRILCVKNFGAQKPHFHHISSMHKAIQIVALQENSFNTKDTKRITKGAKNFPLQILRILCVKNFGAQKPHFYHIPSMHKTMPCTV